MRHLQGAKLALQRRVRLCGERHLEEQVVGHVVLGEEVDLQVVVEALRRS